MFLVGISYYLGSWTGVVILACVIGFIVSAFMAAHVMWMPRFINLLAKRGWVAIPEEGTQQIIMKSGLVYEVATAHGKISAPGTTSRWTPFRMAMDDILSHYGGACWMGNPENFWPFEDDFRWAELFRSPPLEEEKKKRGIIQVWTTKGENYGVSFSQRLNYSFREKLATYYDEVIGAETSEGMAIDALYTITTRMPDPIKARIKTKHYLDVIHTFVKAAIKAKIQSMNYLDFLKARQESTDGKFDDILQYCGYKPLAGTDADPNRPPLAAYILQHMGVEILTLTIEEIIPPDSYAETATATAAAEQKAKVVVIEATAELQRQTLLGQAEGARLEGKLKIVNGDSTGNALSILKLETLEVMSQGEGTTIISGGEGSLPTILNLPVGQKGKPGFTAPKKTVVTPTPAPTTPQEGNTP